MRKALACAMAATVATAGCKVHVETRVERGPLLRKFEREGAPAPGGIRASAQAQWPNLSLGFTAFELCRHEEVEVYAEDHVTERTSSAAGPQIATGISLSLVGIILLAAQGAFSNAPDTRTIDGGGHYGASDRQIARGWSIVTLIAGLPALAMGIVGLIQTGEDTKTVEAEQVTSAKDSVCHEHAADGAVELVTPKGPSGAARKTEGGKVTLSEADLRGVQLLGVTLDGTPVLLPQENMPALEHFEACLDVLPEADPAALAQVPRAKLEERLELAHSCGLIRDAPVKEVIQHLHDELDRRAASPEAPEGERPTPHFSSFDEAMATLKPTIRLGSGPGELARLGDVAPLVNETVYARGLFLERVEENIGVIDVGGQRVLLFIPASAPWMANIDNGSRVEVVGIIQGRQTLGSVDAPLIRAVWMRPAM